MAFVREGYICRRTSGSSRKGRLPIIGNYRNWFLIKNNMGLKLSTIFFDKELIGKKIRLRVEVIEYCRSCGCEIVNKKRCECSVDGND